MALFKGPVYFIGDIVGLWVALFSMVAVGAKAGRSRDERHVKWAHRGR